MPTGLRESSVPAELDCDPRGFPGRLLSAQDLAFSAKSLRTKQHDRADSHQDPGRRFGDHDKTIDRSLKGRGLNSIAVIERARDDHVGLRKIGQRIGFDLRQ